MARKKSNKTSDMAQISISLPQGLVAAVDEMAAVDNRSRSNFIANALKELAKKEGYTVAAVKP